MGPREVTSFPSQLTQKYPFKSSGGEKEWQTDIWENSCCPQSGKFAKKILSYLGQGKAGRRKKKTQKDIFCSGQSTSVISAKFDAVFAFLLNLSTVNNPVRNGGTGAGEIKLIFVSFAFLLQAYVNSYKKVRV